MTSNSQAARQLCAEHVPEVCQLPVMSCDLK